MTLNTIVPRIIPLFINTIVTRIIPLFINTIVPRIIPLLSILLSLALYYYCQYYCHLHHTTKRRIQAIASEHISSVLADIRLVQIEELTKAIDGLKKVGRKNIQLIYFLFTKVYINHSCDRLPVFSELLFHKI